MALLESFLRSHGNLKEMERELGISYPTVRSRVDSLIRALGLGDGAAAPADEPGSAPAPTDARREILERLARGEISAEEASDAIRGLGRMS